VAEEQERSLVDLLRRSRIQWHGVKLGRPDWSYASRSVAFTVQARTQWFHIMFNAFWEALEFQLPPLPPDALTGWRCVIDTFADSPRDFCDPAAAPPVHGPTFAAQPRSVALLLADVADDARRDTARSRRTTSSRRKSALARDPEI
jgi:glycogen operon protein